MSDNDEDDEEELFRIVHARGAIPNEVGPTQEEEEFIWRSTTISLVNSLSGIVSNAAPLSAQNFSQVVQLLLDCYRLRTSQSRYSLSYTTLYLRLGHFLLIYFPPTNVSTHDIWRAVW